MKEKRARYVLLYEKNDITDLCDCDFNRGGIFSNRLLVKKDCYKTCEPFYNSNQEFDVLFFGSSHVDNGISPLLLWKKYGITSYNFAAPGNYIPSNYFRMYEVLRYLKSRGKQLPEVIVMDIYADKDSTYWLHLGWDDFMPSANKMRMTKELLPEKDQAAMMFPFLLYHSRWNELGKDDFITDVNRFYGMFSGDYRLSYPENEIISDSSDQVEVDAENLNYLQEIEEECEVLGIKLIFIHIPYSYRPDLQRMANRICQYENEQGNLCVNYMNQVTELDYDIDFCDTGHLNPTGMRIMTDEVGKLLVDLGLEDHRGETQAVQWDQAYEDYIQFRIAKLRELKNAKSFLMAINDPDLLSTVRIYEGMLGDVQISKLIERLKAEGHQIVITEERPEIVSEDGQVKHYDVYCEIYRRDDSDKLIHLAGFTM